MKRVTLLLIAVAGVGLVIAFAVRRTEGIKEEFRFDAAKLKDASVWTQVNAEPYYISKSVDILCQTVTPSDDDYKRATGRNPHEKASYITVYVNNTGREGML